MGKIYVDQTKLRIQLDVKQDITGATVTNIKYKKPTGVEGFFVATVLDATAGTIYYDAQTDDIDVIGKWTFWAYITFSDARSAPGEPSSLTVYEEGK